MKQTFPEGLKPASILLRLRHDQPFQNYDLIRDFLKQETLAVKNCNLRFVPAVETLNLVPQSRQMRKIC